jgi:fibronectin type 3 domain-containing protein
MINTALDANTNFVDLAVSAGQTYYYVVTAVDSAGVEGAYSAQVVAVIPTP